MLSAAAGALRAAGFDSRAFYQRLSAASLTAAIREQGLREMAERLRVIVPDLPGMGEASVSGYDISIWYGFFLPAKTPRAVVMRLFDAGTQAIRDPKFKDIMSKDGTETAGSKTPEEFGGLIREEAKLTAKAIKESGAKFE